ncbi:putative cortactin-binding protein 2 isoform X1 [Apostichopus japonicus]|uniref:Putative cortactin-binding protein 2 isoform X1 n=1 Tax=Stichopus japonicus TaxID=307972 RepID=A0A2G8JF70_STIJA|nr:putative cortactin-binding protein 2 isoform X1 [Apostichopus japonicus]
MRQKLAAVFKPPQAVHIAQSICCLSRDEEDRGDVKEDGKKGAESDPADILETMVNRHRKAEEHMKKQLEDLSKSHNQVLKELALERQKHAQETAHGDDVTYFLEKDRERLSQQVGSRNKFFQNLPRVVSGKHSLELIISIGLRDSEIEAISRQANGWRKKLSHFDTALPSFQKGLSDWADLLCTASLK